MYLQPHARKIAISKLEWDGHPIRNIDDMRKHFSLEEILKNRGNFLVWLSKNDPEVERVRKVEKILVSQEPDTLQLARLFYPELKDGNEYELLKQLVQHENRIGLIRLLLGRVKEHQFEELFKFCREKGTSQAIHPVLLSCKPFDLDFLKKAIDGQWVSVNNIVEWIIRSGEQEQTSAADFCWNQHLFYERLVKEDVSIQWLELAGRLGYSVASEKIRSQTKVKENSADTPKMSKNYSFDKGGDLVFQYNSIVLKFKSLYDLHGGKYYICSKVLPSELFQAALGGYISKGTKLFPRTHCQDVLKWLKTQFGCDFDFPSKQRRRKATVCYGSLIDDADGVYEWTNSPEEGNSSRYYVVGPNVERTMSCFERAALRPVVKI